MVEDAAVLGSLADLEKQIFLGSKGHILNPVEKTKNLFYIDVTDIGVMKWNDDLGIEVTTKGESPLCVNKPYSVFTYCKLALKESNNEKLKNLVNSMGHYYQAAKEYFE